MKSTALVKVRRDLRRWDRARIAGSRFVSEHVPKSRFAIAAIVTTRDAGETLISGAMPLDADGRRLQGNGRPSAVMFGVPL